MIQKFEETIDLGDGRTIVLETGRLAKQADGSILLKMGDTMLLATVVSAEDAREDVDFLPLSVDYQEKFASVGRFPGGFMKREARPGDNEILTARLIDRALRPLFPDDYHAETFVTVNLISADQHIMADSLAGLAASAAITVSDIPFNGPISEVRVARVNGEFVINPTFEENEIADIELLVGATMENILMVEGEMSEVSEEEMVEAIKIAHDEIKKQCLAQLNLAEKIGNITKREYSHEINDDELREKVINYSFDKIVEVARKQMPKSERRDTINQIEEDFIAENYPEEDDLTPEIKLMVNRYYHEAEKKAIRHLILSENYRVDGRKPDEIRPIWCEVDALPSAHGSAIFTRGETQSLTTVTLGTKVDEKIIDDVLSQGRDRFLLHYNFPPFATGDARPVRGVSRREVGHGNLAHRALKRMLPEGADNPYAIRVVSDILESNGSSSMATVCAGTLALMDSGIQLKKPVSGIAMGLITDNDNYVILSDILGDEDHLGDMDFKVTGTADGITACQMDIKVDGLSYEVLTKALYQAKEGRLHILNKMLEVLDAPRDDYKAHAPRIVQMSIPREMIGAIIGPGGKVVQDIQAKTETVISIEEASNKGIVSISSANKESVDKALNYIRGIVEVPEVGKVYRGTVKSIVPFGAFVEILPGKDGLLHISEIEWRRLKAVEEVLKEGDVIDVKLIDVDPRTNKLKLSRKALLPRDSGFSNRK